MLNNIKSDKGFTIVELLIVIVVIAILAAITIVAFNGIQNRAKTTSGQSLAATIAKKFEAYNSVVGTYPITRSAIQGVSESKIDNLPSSNTVAATAPLILPASDTLFSGTALEPSTGNSGQSVRVSGSATGGRVYYFNYEAGSGEKNVAYGAGS